MMFYNILVYGLTHALVDASCAFVIFFGLKLKVSAIEFFNLAVLYDVVAFGFQAPLGILIDKFRVPKISAVLGCFLTIFSIAIVNNYSLLAILLAGVGNALFHLGGGTISLNIISKKAAVPGIFVAPGALGLAIGTLLGKGNYNAGWVFIFLLSFSIVAIFYSKEPIIDYQVGKVKPAGNIFWPVLIFLMFSVSIRSLVGMVVSFSWKSNMTLFWILTLAVVGGKAFGGVLADRFGWKKVGVVSLLISAPLLSFAAGKPLLAILGMFLFQMTMPITLSAISNLLPGRPGFSFGLTCLALILGALPSFFGFKDILGNQWIILLMIICSAVTIFAALTANREVFLKREE